MRRLAQALCTHPARTLPPGWLKAIVRTLDLKLLSALLSIRQELRFGPLDRGGPTARGNPEPPNVAAALDYHIVQPLPVSRRR
jgi:hypothetical protein